MLLTALRHRETGTAPYNRSGTRVRWRRWEQQQSPQCHRRKLGKESIAGQAAVASVHRLGILLLTVTGLAASARESVAIPSDDLLKSLQANADVNDFAGILSPADKAAIESRCRELREKTGAQLAVVTLKSLEGGSLEDFSFKLAEKWGIHQQGKKNGILVLVAMQEHKSRIEVGYDLEPIVPDILAGRIIDQQLRPQFRAGQYGAGLLAATSALVDLVEKGEPADMAAIKASQRRQPDGNPVMAVLFIAIFVASGGLITGASLRTRQGPGVVFGSIFAGGPMFIAWIIAGAVALLVHVPLALLSAATGWLMAGQPPTTRRRSWLQSTGIGSWDWSSMGTSGGGWSSGGGGGFSGDWGGFGGGGGGFGGGGASGGW
jgi:uncharacterized protein